MKLFPVALLSLATAAHAFAPSRLSGPSESTELSALSRRSVISVTSGFLLGTLASPRVSNAGTANPFFEEEINWEPSQMATGNKLDVNGAFVVCTIREVKSI